MLIQMLALSLSLSLSFSLSLSLPLSPSPLSFSLSLSLFLSPRPYWFYREEGPSSSLRTLEHSGTTVKDTCANTFLPLVTHADGCFGRCLLFGVIVVSVSVSVLVSVVNVYNVG